jgi:hypothetical protein
MNFKKKLVTGTALLSTSMIFLAACSQPDIMYDGKKQSVNSVEEQIADKLEVENPDLDLEVNITEEADD